MEDNFSGKSKFSKVLLWVVRVALALVGIIYLLFYAPFLANHQLLIPMRKSFYENVLEKVFLPTRLPYRLMVREVKTLDNGKKEYGYTLIGRFVAIDATNEILILQDLNSREWRLQYHPYPAVEGGAYRNLMVSEVRFDKDRTTTSQIAYYLYNKGKTEETASYFQAGDIVAVLWNETRTLPTILKDKESVIPLQGSGKIPVYKIMAK